MAAKAESKAAKAESKTNPELALWKAAFPDAAVLVPVPGSITITHTLARNKFGIPYGPVALNGVPWTHPLVINALYGYQTVGGVTGNWYGIILTEVAGKKGRRSACEVFRHKLQKYGLDASSDHYHWKGSDAPMFAIHVSSYRLSTTEFITGLLRALRAYGESVKRNGVRHSGSLETNRSHDRSSRSHTRPFSSTVRKMWQLAFPDAAPLTDNLMTYTFKGNTIKIMDHPMTLNGTTWTHPLVVNALYGYQKVGGVIGNWHEVMLMEVPGRGSLPSATEVYCRELERQGFNVQGDHYHWKGSAQTMFAIHHASYDMTPEDFTHGTVLALMAYANAATLNAG